MADVEDILGEAPRRAFFHDFPDALGGHVEKFGPEVGISGWALNYDMPEEVLTIEVVVDGVVVAEGRTGLPRADVAAGAGAAMPGFQFNDDEVARLTRLAQLCRHSAVTFRIAGSSVLLSCNHEAPSLALLFPEAPVGGRAEATAKFDLLARLSDLRARAAMLTAPVLCPDADQLAGFIEALALDACGCVWLAGWIRPSSVVDCASLILDGEKSPAGLALTRFERADLPAGCLGFIGVLLTSWRPSGAAEIHLFMNEDGRLLHGTTAMQVMSFAEFASLHLPSLARGQTGYAGTLRHMLSRPEDWNPSVKIGLPVHAAVDRVLLLPGFGALISGWVVSPIRDVSDFALRLGTAILHCDRNSLYNVARPDLAVSFPGHSQALECAGFVARFRGNFLPEDLTNPILKVVYSDGGSSNHAVDGQSLCHVRHDPDLAVARHLFPALNSEPFFPEFAAALRAEARAELGACRPYALARAKQVLIFVLPADRSDAFLLMTTVDQRLRRQPDPPGVAFIGATRESRALAVALMDAIGETSQIAYSLFLMRQTEYAFYCLPSILGEIGATRFAFLGSGIFLTEAGWLAAFRGLVENRRGITLFEIGDPASPTREPEISAQCFVWSALPFAIWLNEVPFYLGGFHEDNGISRATDDLRVQRGAARRSAPEKFSAMAALINRFAALA